MGSIRTKLETIFNIRPDEVTPVAWLLIHSFFIGLTIVFFETAAYTLFLTNFETAYLTQVYIFSAPVMMGIGFIYSKFEECLPFPKLLSSTLIFLACFTLILYVCYEKIEFKWVSMTILIWHNVQVVLTNIEFWSLSGYILDVRQGKRLFGLVGIGEIAAGIIGGFSIPILMKIISIPELLLISAIGMLCCLFVLRHITHTFKEQLSVDIGKERKEEKISLSGLLKDRYIILFFAFSVLTVFGYYLLDYIFYDQVDIHLQDEKRIASFLGIFLAVLGCVNLVSNSFVPGRVLIRYGLGFGLLAVPVVVALGTFIGWGVLKFDNLRIFFMMMVVTKLFDEVARVSIEKPSVQILYQPIPSTHRLKVQTLVETLVEPLGGALAGLTIWLLTSYFSMKSHNFIEFMFFTLAIWIPVVIKLRKQYTDVLKVRITKRRIDVGDISQNDPATRIFLEEGLKKSDPGEVIYCLNVLEKIEHEGFETFMINLLDHEAHQVRKFVLERIGELRMTSALDFVKERLEIEETPHVLGAALQTLCAISETEGFEQVFPYVKHKELEIRKGAMVALLRNSGIDGVLAAGADFNILVNSDEPRERTLAAQVLGEVGISGFFRPLLNLLEDSDLKVRAVAIVASGKLKNPNLLPLLLKNLSVPDVRRETVSAITAFGEKILPELEAAFDEQDQPREIRIRIIRILGKIGGENAIAILNKKIDSSEEDIRNRILEALLFCKYRAIGKKETERILKRIRKEVEDATWTLGALLDIGEYEYASHLKRALGSEIDKNRRRIFFLLAMIYSPDTILSAQKNLASESGKIKATAIEALSNIISQNIWEILSPLIEDFTFDRSYAELVTKFPQSKIGFHERLKAILARSNEVTSSWTKACALFTIGKIRTMEFYDTIISALSEPDDTVKETAIWALGCLNPNDLPERLQHFTRDKSERVAQYARFTINSVGFASIPMSKGYLTRSGRYTIELFRNILMDPGERRARRCRAANILSRFKGPVARSVLMEALTIPDMTIRTASLDALVKGRFRIEGKDRDNLLMLIDREAKEGQHIIRSIATLMPEKYSERLVQALNQEVIHNRKRILSVLVLLNGAYDSLNTVFYWYVYQDSHPVPKDVMVTLLGLLAKIEEKELRQLAFRLFHQYRGPESLKELKGVANCHLPEKVEENLKKIAFDTSAFTLSWSRICALEMIVNLHLFQFTPQIVEKLKEPDDIVRATAVWALFKLSPKLYEKYARRLEGDPSPLVSRTAKQLRAEH